MKVGFHVSISGSVDVAVDRAVNLGCTTFQIFTRSPRQWYSSKLEPEVIESFSDKVKKHNLQPVFAHMPYLPNLASPKDDVYKKSVMTLGSELKRCEQLQIPYLVTHLGSHLGKGKEVGFERLINGINKVLSVSNGKVALLLENTAGTKNSMGSTFEDIQYIIDQLTHQDCVGVCFDTSHAFGAGYDLRTKETVQETITSIEDTVGFKKVKLVHLNDSKGELNSRIDRHDHIGLGKIGEDGFRNILASKFGDLPLIMETPIDERRDDVGNLKKFKELYRKN